PKIAIRDGAVPTPWWPVPGHGDTVISCEWRGIAGISSTGPQLTGETRLPGWGARIRTWEWRNQNPLPYHLATPQQYRRVAANRFRMRRLNHSGADPFNQRSRLIHKKQRHPLTGLEPGLDYPAMSYRAPVADIAFTLKHAAGLKTALAEGIYGDLDEETVDSVLAEAGRYASDVIAPLNSIGDKFGTPFKDGKVTTPPGWKDAYAAWAAAGWNGLAAPADWGGQELPHAVNAACIEMWNSASMAFGIGPVLTMAAIDALHAYGSDTLKKEYLSKLISGEWMGTMQLTEPQAGSDVGALRSKAERASDGTYRITGSKIFITYGEHDLTDNIIHFVL